jgi:sugar (pentulose or hexulose) kinase
MIAQPILGIDIGGSGIKGAVVDVAQGTFMSQRFRLPTPQPATPPPGSVLARPGPGPRHSAILA